MSSAVEAASPATVAEVVNTELLLAPIAGENPSGAYLRHSETYDKIERARQSDDNFAKGDWTSETKTADWEKVETLSVEALASQTKDLKICAWMTEALIINYGFAGLRDGLKVMRGLHQNFWETLYPEIDRGDAEDTDDDAAPVEVDLTARVNALTLLDRLAADALRDVPLTQSRTGADYSYTQWEGSKQFVVPENQSDADPSDIERANALRSEAAEEGKITSEDWNKAKASTPFAFYETTLAVLDECRAEYQTLNSVVDERYQRDAPSLRALEKTLDEIRTQVERVYKEKRPPEAAAPKDSDDGAHPASAAPHDLVDVHAGGTAGSASVGGTPRSREEALRKLGEVAAYFRRAEPHSPVSYLVQRAIKWGQMPLEAWLEDVVKDAGVLDSMRETLG
ncbi:MAG TPA: type VI secretion system protein TssA, partial [Pyrinomonadaceae bacterium]|nr:type VI secretion system protein TssA [Pyrinomonadaceae bacterium]